MRNQSHKNQKKKNNNFNSLHLWCRLFSLTLSSDTSVSPVLSVHKNSALAGLVARNHQRNSLVFSTVSANCQSPGKWQFPVPALLAKLSQWSECHSNTGSKSHCFPPANVVPWPKISNHLHHNSFDNFRLSSPLTFPPQFHNIMDRGWISLNNPSSRKEPCHDRRE